MSIFISFIGPGEVCLLTDGQFSGNGVLQGVRRKTWAANRVPLIMTARGVESLIHVVFNDLVSIADEIGTAAFVGNLQEIVDGLQRRHGHTFANPLADGGEPHCDFCLVGWVPGVGPFHRVFSTDKLGIFSDESTGDAGRKKHGAWRVYNPGDEPGMSFGDWPAPRELVAAGIPFPKRGERLSAWLTKYGAAAVDILRKRVDHYDKETGEPRYLIGGQLDLTVIDAHGGSTRTLCTWPDQIGLPIDPFRAAA